MLSENAKDLLKRKYCAPGEDFTDLCKRVATHIAQAEEEGKRGYWEQSFFDILSHLEFLPNTPTLVNAGKGTGQLSGCFVVPIEDSIEGIFEAIKHTAMIHKSGGGTGFSFSHIRQKGAETSNGIAKAAGPIAFIDAFNTSVGAVTQGGNRPGGNMAILSVNHPDVMDFIEAKRVEGVLSNFNLSVAITDEFMKDVEYDRKSDLIDPHTELLYDRINAKDLFESIAKEAWEKGDPGVVFIDRVNADDPTPWLGPIEATNPCGEQPLHPFESCNLGSIDLSKFIIERDRDFDWVRLQVAVRTAVRFLDDVIDVNVYPLDIIAETTKNTRKIGLGVMGWADALIKMGIIYDSEEALKRAEFVMRFIQSAAHEYSIELAEEKGAYPAYIEDTRTFHNPEQVQKPQRNACVTTIAPTGRLSIIADCSGGIEPIWDIEFPRTQAGETVIDKHPLWGHYDIELFRKALEIPWEWHVKMQAAFQKHVDNAVSKTINLPNEATWEDILGAYSLSYELGCKGVTVYRDGCRDFQVYGTRSPEEEARSRKRPSVTFGTTESIPITCGKLYVTVNQDGQGICEVFASLGKSGGCINAHLETIGRLASNSLRSGVAIDQVIRTLSDVRCPKPSWHQGVNLTSCIDAIASVLRARANLAATGGNTKQITGQCPICSGLLVHQEGCDICLSCGHSSCG